MADQVQSGLLSPFLRSRRLVVARPLLKGRVLDFGCGTGQLASSVTPEAYLGVDRDKASLEIARQQFPRHQFAESLPANSAFDTIIALAVVEHIQQPQHLLQQFKALLGPGGQIVLTTPHPAFEWAHEWGAKLGLCSADAAEEHETLLDAAAMQNLSRAVGLTLADSRRFLFGMNQLFVVRA
jgi:2-polyprenyl-3-methyl-5-hydroxy-6-metoxy-1,4-benzoquinol methylase